MLDTVRRYVEAGREALTPKKAEELARALAKQGQARADQVQQLAKELAEWSKKNSDRLATTIRREVKKQFDKAGVATKDDVESLKTRIRKIETDVKASKPAARPKTAAKPVTPRKSTARRPAGTTPPTIGGGTAGEGPTTTA